jgi:hypothetical protein
MLLRILPFALYRSPLSVQALQSTSCQSYVSYATTAAEPLNGRKPDHYQVQASYIFHVWLRLTVTNNSKLGLLYDWRQAPWDSPPVTFFSDRTLAVVVLMWHPLWREDGSVVYSCCWSSPAQSFSGPSPAGLVTTFCCLRFETPPAWRARSP